MPSTVSVANNSLHPPTRPSMSHKDKKHSRSASHPFPSFLRPGKKKSHQELQVESDSTDDDDVVASANLDGQTPGQMLRRSKSGKGPEEKGVETGHCMACDSKVKWPTGLKVFRCSACLTINDLEPTASKHSERGVGPLSVDRTRAIIDRCVTAYLLSRCKAPPERDSPSKIPDFSTPTKSPNIPQPPPSSNGSPLKESWTNDAPARPTRLPPPPPPGSLKPRTASESHYGKRPDRLLSGHTLEKEPEPERRSSIFKPLEDYIIATVGNHECLNVAFSTHRPQLAPRTRSESAAGRANQSARERSNNSPGAYMEQLDAKTLLLGDIGDNAGWWMGQVERNRSHRVLPQRQDSEQTRAETRSQPNLVTSKSACINWSALSDWYDAVLTAGCNWRAKLQRMQNSPDSGIDINLNAQDIHDIEERITEERIHAQRTLLKVTENILKRPGGPLKEPSSIRFLLILMSNPLLYPNNIGPLPRRKSSSAGIRPNMPQPPSQRLDVPIQSSPPGQSPRRSPRTGIDFQHSGIIKRILGLMAYLPIDCHRYLVTWFSRFSEEHFKRFMDLVARFVSYRLSRNTERRRGNSNANPVAGLIPEFGGTGANSSAQLHAALGLSTSAKAVEDRKNQPLPYCDDWQLKSASKVMALMYAANNAFYSRRAEDINLSPSAPSSTNGAAQRRAMSRGQLLPTSNFYNTLLDYVDLIADFEAWEAKRGQFAFCQYPFFLSIGAKIKIMEHDARRQMENKAREAFFDSIMTHRQVEQYFNLKIRRDCLVDDSLQRISESVGSGSGEIKKGLKVHFIGEEGVDAGGLRKEWFLLLVREVFDPNNGLFIYDSESQFCYFNSLTFETSDQFFLVGALLGLAIYNSTILDVALPPFAFKKLLASAPTTSSGPSSNHPNPPRPPYSPTLEDLAEYRPALAHGLRQLLDFDGDVENTFCRNFVGEIDRYGKVEEVPLCPGGENRAVTNNNRQEFVDLYVRYLLDTSVARQFEPFKRGFFTVCGGNALSLFRPEEIELLVRGSDEPLDINSLRAVAVYDNWGPNDPTTSKSLPDPSPTVPVLRWFWEFFELAGPADQRRILSFITGSDRIPAVGATNLVIKISCAGEDSERYPTARTCFNQLVLYRYRSRRRLVEKLWGAVTESEGFGLK